MIGRIRKLKWIPSFRDIVFLVLNRNMRTIVYLFLLFYSFGIVGYAQNLPWKFDEFTDKPLVTHYPYSEISFSTRIERYKNELQKHPTARPVIIFYKSRVQDEANRYETMRWFETPRQELRAIRRFDDPSKVSEVFGGYREENTIEFWIVPRSAAPPQPTPTISESEAIICPEIRVVSPGFHFDKSKPVTFTTRLDTDVNFTPSYEWSVTNGEIISGRNNVMVTIDVTKSTSAPVTAIVNVGGLPALCRQGRLATLQVGSQPYLFDYLESFLETDLSARLDNLMITVHNEPTLKAYLISYSPRTGPSAGKNFGLTHTRRAFAFRRYPYDQVVLVDGGIRDVATFEMWLVPPGSDPPKSRPFADKRFIRKARL